MTGCPRNDFRPNLDVSVHVSGRVILRSTLYHLGGIQIHWISIALKSSNHK